MIIVACSSDHNESKGYIVISRGCFAAYILFHCLLKSSACLLICIGNLSKLYTKLVPLFQGPAIAPAM